MRDYIALGATPSNEDCTQVGSSNYTESAKAECQRYIALLRDICGEEPEGAYLTTKSFSHDFGTYYEVVCYYDPQVPAALEYAFRVDREAPTTWESTRE